MKGHVLSWGLCKDSTKVLPLLTPSGQTSEPSYGACMAPSCGLATLRQSLCR